MMNRRDFFRRATAAAVGALTLDPERLLWTPGERSFFDLGAGLRDDTAYIQGLIDGGGVVWLPAGRYRITRTLRLPFGQSLIGHGTTLEWVGADEGPQMNADDGPILRVVGPWQ